MVKIKDFRQIEDYVYEIPSSFREDMHVPARFYADAALLEDVKNDKSLDQLVNTATLPGAFKYALAMPDIHQGYGFPIGGVAAFDPEEGGVVSAGGVGFDISCGVRTLHTGLDRTHLGEQLDALAPLTVILLTFPRECSAKLSHIIKKSKNIKQKKIPPQKQTVTAATGGSGSFTVDSSLDIFTPENIGKAVYLFTVAEQVLRKFRRIIQDLEIQTANITKSGTISNLNLTSALTQDLDKNTNKTKQ